ncbi:MAG: oxidoreductase [Gammaproteobacteria bacterium]|nr:oxidoreductase [Gammaproteobacteria bacterium]
MESFKAFRIHIEDKQTRAGFEQLSLDDLTDGEVVIRAAYSDINYKDALAATGKGKILRRAPLNGGVDVSGHVVSSSDTRFIEGDAVLVCGCNLSEDLDGGYSEIVRVPASAVVPLPDGLTLHEAMALGTAGLTAGMAVHRMLENHQQPDMGPILVTGATGGVGSLAIDILAAQGFEVVAFTGKSEQADYLYKLGAAQICSRHDVEMGTRPLEKSLWGGAVDNVGGETLGWLTRTVHPLGNIASIGLAGGFKLETTVMPFILRGVSLLGINSVLPPMQLRQQVWARLASDFKPRHLDQIANRTIAFDELPQAFDGYVEGTVTGRTVVRIGGE